MPGLKCIVDSGLATPAQLEKAKADIQSMKESGLTDEQAGKQAQYNFAREVHRDIYNKLNELRKEANIPEEDYKPPTDRSAEIPDIEKDFEKRKADAKAANEKRNQANKPADKQDKDTGTDQKAANETGTAETGKPKIRVNADISHLAVRFNVPLEVAAKIEEARKASKTVEEFKQKVADILQQHRASEADTVETDLNLEGINPDYISAIGGRLAKSVNQDQSELVAAANETGETVKANLDSRAVTFSNVQDPLGSLYETLTGENYTDNERGVAAAYIAAQRLFSKNENDFISKLFGKAANAKDAVRIINSSEPKSPLISANTSGHITINAYKLGQRLKEFGGEKRFMEWLEYALQEEAIHLASYKVASIEDFNAVADEMTDKQKQAVQDIYAGKLRTKQMDKQQLAAEYLRILVQERLSGVSTELFRPSAVKKETRGLLSKLLAFIKQAFSGKTNPKANDIVNKIESYIKGEVEGNEIAKPKVKIFERPEMEYPVYRVEINGKEYFVQRADEMNSGSAWYEVKKVRGLWSAVGDENKKRGNPWSGFLGFTQVEALSMLSSRSDFEAGVSQDELDGLLDDYFNSEGEFSQQAQPDVEQEKQSEESEEYVFGEKKFDSQTDPIKGFELKYRDEFNQVFGTDKTMQARWDEMPSEERFRAQVNMLESGKEMIGLAQTMFGGADINVYGPQLLRYIKRMQSDGTNKKAILAGTFLGELKEATERDNKFNDATRKLYADATMVWTGIMHEAGLNLVAGRLLKIYRDHNFADLGTFAGIILNEYVSKAADSVKNAETETEMKDEDVVSYNKKRSKGKTEAEVSEEQKARNEARAKAKQEKQNKAAKKEEYSKEAKEKEDAIIKKYGSVDNFWKSIKDDTDELNKNCK